MKKDGLLNAELISEIAAIGHTQYMVISDVGLPVPKGVKVIDLALAPGVPSFAQVLEAVDSELVSESYILAEEIREQNAGLDQSIGERMGDRPAAYIPHEELKKLTREAQVIVRSGEVSPYANIVLVAGVNF